MALSGTPTRQVLCMLLSKDEATLYTGDYGKSVIAWDVAYALDPVGQCKLDPGLKASGFNL